MDITARKYKFIEQFMKIVNPKKLERFEALMRAEEIPDDEIVTYTIKGRPVTREQYIKNNLEAVESFEKGDFKTHTEIKNKYSGQ